MTLRTTGKCQRTRGPRAKSRLLLANASHSASSSSRIEARTRSSDTHAPLSREPRTPARQGIDRARARGLAFALTVRLRVERVTGRQGSLHRLAAPATRVASLLPGRRLILLPNGTATSRALGPHSAVVHHPPRGRGATSALAPHLKRRASVGAPGSRRRQAGDLWAAERVLRGHDYAPGTGTRVPRHAGLGCAFHTGQQHSFGRSDIGSPQRDAGEHHQFRATGHTRFRSAGAI